MGLVEYEERSCTNCYQKYTPRSAQQKYCCSDCRKEFIRKENTEKAHPSLDTTAKFKPVTDFMKEYYEKTGKYIQYGKAVAMIEQLKKKKHY